MASPRSVVLRYIGAELAISSSSLAHEKDRVFELDKAGHWQERGKLRGGQLRDTWSHVKLCADLETLCCPGSKEADIHIQKLIDHICKFGVPDVFRASIPGRRRYCGVGVWVRDIVDALGGGMSVEEIMAVILDKMYSYLRAETAHDKIEAHAETTRLIANIARALQGVADQGHQAGGRLC